MFRHYLGLHQGNTKKNCGSLAYIQDQLDTSQTSGVKETHVTGSGTGHINPTTIKHKMEATHSAQYQNINNYKKQYKCAKKRL